MSTLYSKIISIVLWVLMGISVILLVLYLVKN